MLFSPLIPVVLLVPLLANTIQGDQHAREKGNVMMNLVTRCEVSVDDHGRIYPSACPVGRSVRFAANSPITRAFSDTVQTALFVRPLFHVVCPNIGIRRLMVP